jgi:plasmid stabilization system protein ParE
MSRQRISPLQQVEADYRSIIERTERERVKARARRRRALQTESDAGRTYREIGDEIGIKNTRVSQIINGQNR